ncbi:hypothetical protein J6590_043363 [Homalodisca vitripennis]|nr:hypothetical protein J6590_043363 [Homalodisca vitripennis]
MRRRLYLNPLKCRDNSWLHGLYNWIEGYHPRLTLLLHNAHTLPEQRPSSECDQLMSLPISYPPHFHISRPRRRVTLALLPTRGRCITCLRFAPQRSLQYREYERSNFGLHIF